MNIIKDLFNPSSKKFFYALVKCSNCKEEIKVRIDPSSDLQIEYEPKKPGHYYTIKKEILGKNCSRLMGITIGLTRKKEYLFAEPILCQCIRFYKG